MITTLLVFLCMPVVDYPHVYQLKATITRQRFEMGFESGSDFQWHITTNAFPLNINYPPKTIESKIQQCTKVIQKRLQTTPQEKVKSQPYPFQVGGKSVVFTKRVDSAGVCAVIALGVQHNSRFEIEKLWIQSECEEDITLKWNKTIMLNRPETRL